MLLTAFTTRKMQNATMSEVNHKSDEITVVPGDRFVSQCVGWSRRN